MTTFPGSPRVLRGALVAVDPATLESKVVPFQYNPALVQRAFQVTTTTAGAGAGQRAGAPVETVQLEVVLDATDELEAGKPGRRVPAGIAAILGLVSPLAADVHSNRALAEQGMIEILPPDAPLVLFVYGPSRVEPVVLTELSISEEAHDAQLRPLRARIALGMQVLRYADLPASQIAYALSLANQVARESIADHLAGDAVAGAIARGALDAL